MNEEIIEGQIQFCIYPDSGRSPEATERAIHQQLANAFDRVDAEAKGYAFFLRDGKRERVTMLGNVTPERKEYMEAQFADEVAASA